MNDVIFVYPIPGTKKMKIFSDHKIWWGALAIGSLIVATQTTSDLGIGRILGKSTGMLLFSLVLGGIPWLTYKLIRKPITSVQRMTQITVAWGLVVASQLIVANSTDLQKDQVVTFHPPGCNYSVLFERTPKYYTTHKASADGKLAKVVGAELTVSNGEGLVRAECVSLIHDVNQIDQDSAVTAMQQIALDLGLMRPNFAFEEGNLGKVATLTGVKETERGRVITRVINFHGPKSIMTLYLVALSSDFQTSQMVRFVQSIKMM